MSMKNISLIYFMQQLVQSIKTLTSKIVLNLKTILDFLFKSKNILLLPYNIVIAIYTTKQYFYIQQIILTLKASKYYTNLH